MPPETTPPEGEQESGGGVEKRIAQLTKQKHDAGRRAEAAESAQGALTDQVVSLQSTVDSLTARLAIAPPAPASDPLTALLGGSKKADQSASPAGVPALDIAAAIKSAVGEALAPLVAGQKQQAESAALEQAQSRSYQEAAKEFLPAALVDGSVEQSTFDAVFSRSQALQLDPDGPAIALAAVAGILSQGARTSQVQEAKKQAASMPPSVTNPLMRIGDLPSGKADVGEAVKALAHLGETEGLTNDGLQALIGLKTGRAKLTPE